MIPILCDSNHKYHNAIRGRYWKFILQYVICSNKFRIRNIKVVTENHHNDLSIRGRHMSERACDES